MKGLSIGPVLTLAASDALAQGWTNSNTHSTPGYTRSNGTYVQPYVAISPNGTQRDNFSASGNTDPYTGQVSTHTPRY